jgi:hypothetical protein
MKLIKENETLWFSPPDASIVTEEKNRSLLYAFLRQHNFPGSRPCWRCGNPVCEPESTLIEEASDSRTSTSTMGTTQKTTFLGYTLFVGVSRCSQCAEKELLITHSGKLITKLGCLTFLLTLFVLFALIYFFPKGFETVHPAVQAIIFSLPIIGFALYAIIVMPLKVKKLEKLGLNMKTHPEVYDARAYSAQQVGNRPT